MNIRIIRGQNQIGGSIIEISSEATKIILDVGSELDETTPVTPDVDGLFSGMPSYDAVFISHYHGDHIGLLDRVLKEIPIYIGKAACEVTNAARKYTRKPEYSFTGFFESGKPFNIGDMVITPYLCDHSAFDSYMFHIACNGKTLLYSGDFRANGRKNFSALLKRLPSVDVLIIEGTTLSRISAAPVTEEELEKRAVEVIARNDTPVFVLMAATNIDRLVTVYKATRRNNRILLQDLYLAAVSSAAGKNIPNPKDFSDIRVLLTNGSNERYKELSTYGQAKIGKQSVAKKKFVMCIRPSMRCYLDKLSELVPFEDSLLIYSMWDGYKKKEDMADFLTYMHGKGVKIVSLHTSGHADSDTIDAIIQAVQPKAIIPVHTENAAWFQRYHDIQVVKDQLFCF